MTLGANPHEGFPFRLLNVAAVLGLAAILARTDRGRVVRAAILGLPIASRIAVTGSLIAPKGSVIQHCHIQGVPSPDLAAISEAFAGALGKALPAPGAGIYLRESS